MRNFNSDVDDKLKKDGWKGEAVCYIGLYLSADNTRVDRGNFMVKGKLTDESLRIEANKIWTEADDSVVLVLNFPKAEVFTFNESGLSSDIVRQEDIQHGFYLISGETAPQVILETDYEEHGVGKFCMRMMCTVSKSGQESSSSTPCTCTRRARARCWPATSSRRAPHGRLCGSRRGKCRCC